MNRQLHIAWPGNPDCQQSMWSFLQLTGLADRTGFLRQYNTYGGSISAAHAYQRVVNRDWHPIDPTHGYIDHEPPNWVWETWRDLAPRASVDTVQDYRQAYRALLERDGRPERLAIYGFPVSHRNPPAGFGVADADRWQAAGKLIDGFDWVWIDLYPPGRVDLSGWMDDPEPHRNRAITQYHAAKMYGIEVIPVLYLRPGVHVRRYAEVYCEALADAGCDSVGIWMDLRDSAHLSRAMRAMTEALPALRRFVGVE
jgi:hypothetical protein